MYTNCFGDNVYRGVYFEIIKYFQSGGANWRVKLCVMRILRKPRIMHKNNITQVRKVIYIKLEKQYNKSYPLECHLCNANDRVYIRYL